MADVGTTADILSRLNINDLDAEWVKDTWEKDFTDVDPLPINVESDLQENNYHALILRKALDCLSPWARGEEGAAGEGFWSVLVENDLPHRHLIALLFYILDAGTKRLANVEQREAGILAAQVYFALISIPGSGAFKVFHPTLFQKAADCFKFWVHQDQQSRKRKSSPVRSTQGQRKGKSRKTEKEREPSHDGLDIEAFSDEEDEEVNTMSPQEKERLHKRLVGLFKDFVHLLRTHSLRESPQTTQDLLQLMASLTKVDPELFDGSFDLEIDVSRVQSVAKLAYMALSLLTTSSHGEPVVMVTAVFKHMLPNILMLMGDNNKAIAAQTIPRDVQRAKDQAVAFVCHMVKMSGEVVHNSVRVLLQHMCTKVPDKSEYRSKVAQAVMNIMKELPSLAWAKMVEWIYKFSRNAKISYRVFGLDIICLMLLEPERSPDDDLPAEYTGFLTHAFLIQVLLSRCSDIASTVRTRAITGFSQCALSHEPGIIQAIKDIMTPRMNIRGAKSRVVPTPEASRVKPATDKGAGEVSGEPSGDAAERPGQGQADPGGSADNNAPTEKIPTEPHRTPGYVLGPSGTPVSLQLTPGISITLIDGKGVMSMLRRRAGDDKVNVRKAALTALENVIRMNPDGFNKQDLDILRERCQDPSLSVRKQALHSLTDLLLDIPYNKDLQSAWLDGVLPMVLDRETTAQDKCMEYLEQILLNNIVPYSRSNNEEHVMVWSLLDIMAGHQSVELRRFLQKACQFWGRKGHLKTKLVNSLQTHVGTSNNTGAWMLLAELAPFMPKFDTNFIVDYWNQVARTAPEAEYGMVHHVLTVMSYVAKHIPHDCISQLTVDLRQRLMKFDSPPELVSVTVSTLNKLCQAQAEDKEAAKRMTDVWFGELLQACDRYLSQVILFDNQDESIDEDVIVRHLFTLGEIAQLCPERTPRRVFTLVQSLIAAPVITSVDGSSQQPSGMSSDEAYPQSSLVTPQEISPQSSATSSQRQSSQFPSGSSQEKSPTCFSQFSQNTQVLSQFKGSKMSSKVRAHAFVTLGKLCLQNEDIAKKCVAAMARELETSPDPSVRNNVVVIMCDLCVRYTTLVDRYVSNVAACLKDDNPLVREQTLTLLTHLLQEDFLKWKGALFYRFIVALADEAKHIRNFAEYCLIHILHQRHPGMFFQHFVECVFHFNSYEGHPVYNKFSQTEREKKMFSLKGKANAEKRMLIYRFLLEHMVDEHRFQLTAKLCQEILGGVVDGVIPLNDDSSALLQDALGILACKEIKLASMRTKPHDDVADEQDMAAVVMATAKKTLITQVVKKNVIENIVPIVMSLKHMLEKHRSSVLRDLMTYLRELMKDYKTEVKDILSADKQVANEIEFDLRKFEEQQEELARQQELQRLRRSSAISLGGESPAMVLSPARRGSVGGVPGSPKTPPIVKTPRPLAAVAANNDDKAATPARSVSMSVAAIVNSARKTVERIQRAKVAHPSPLVARPTSATPRKTQTPNKGPPVAKERTDVKENIMKTPTNKNTRSRGQINRAISTPAGVIGNITFHQADQNLSMIPPSPIPSSIPMRLYSNNGNQKVPGTPSWTAKLDEEDEAQEPAKKRDKDVLLMFSPERPTPKPRTWNVKAPNQSQDRGKGDGVSNDNACQQGGSGSDDDNANTFVSLRTRKATMEEEKGNNDSISQRTRRRSRPRAK